MYARDHAQIVTPIGMVHIEGDDDSIVAIRIGFPAEQPIRGSAAAVRVAGEQLEAYFAGQRCSFDLPLPRLSSPRGEVLRAGLIGVSYGETMSYGELARRLNSGARAIGQLCARNPLPIVVPCHRVLGAGGALGHYSAGAGPETKSWLLEHERRILKGE